MKSRKRFFTLIELLVVVAIISILAAVAVPNFLEAQTRSKVTRSKVDLASLKAGVRSYYGDHLVYPPHPEERLELLRSYLPEKKTTKEQDDAEKSDSASRSMEMESIMMGMGGFGGSSRTDSQPAGFHQTASDLEALTTPVAYIAGLLPLDAMDQDRASEDKGFRYINFWQAGEFEPTIREVNREERFALFGYGPSGRARAGNPVAMPWVPYDPTNGTISGGEIFMSGSDLQPQDYLSPVK